MGYVRTDDSRRLDIDELRRVILSCDNTGIKDKAIDDNVFEKKPSLVGKYKDDDEDFGQKVVCVTSGVSFLGIAVVRQLLLRGYSVRILVDTQDDIERLGEMELAGANNLNGVVLANLNQPHTLMEAFHGCFGVFHTASFVDPAGLSGYSKSMAEIEVNSTKNVVEACASTPSVKRCVLTSSLLACIWRDNSISNLSFVVDHHCWSDEHLCQNKKLWYALGKLRAERAAWRIAEEKGLELTTMCPGLVTGPRFSHRSPTSTVAYLKGAQEMYANRLLATVDVNRLAEVHVRVFEEMSKSASGRYVCFDQVVESVEEFQKLAEEIGMDMNVMPGNEISNNHPARFQLSSRKLSSLLSRTQRCINEY